MSLADHAGRLEPPPFRCKYARALAGITDREPDHVDQFTSAVAAGTLTGEEWARILTEEGFPVSGSVTRKHLSGRCGCTA